MEVVSYQSRPALRRPVLVGAFEGWNDAAEAATSTVGFLKRRWDAKSFASVDPEEFFDLQFHRPQIVAGEDGTRHIQWPSTDFSYAAIPGVERDVVLLSAPEPSMRWRTYCRALIEVARQTDVQLVVTMGALLAGRPHTRPIRVTGTSSDPELAQRLDLPSSKYEGPTGIVGVLNDACRHAGIPAVSLWAWVPHYLHASPSPTATLALTERLRSLLHFEADTTELQRASEEYDARVQAAVGEDDELHEQIGELERQADEEELRDLPSGDELAAEVERYLAEHRPDDER